MDEIKLKPCPFCGGQVVFAPDIMTYQSNMQGWRFKISCSGCGVAFPDKGWHVLMRFGGDGNIDFVRDDRPEALALWNGRADNG